MRHLFYCVLLISLVACSTLSIKGISSKYTTIKGTIVAPPILDNGGERLTLYIKVLNPQENKEDILAAIAENKPQKEILKTLSQKIIDSNSEIFLYGKKIEATQWKEFIESIDFEIAAVGVYIPAQRKYQIVLTGYGDSLAYAIRAFEWKGFIQTIGKTAVKTVL